VAGKLRCAAAVRNSSATRRPETPAAAPARAQDPASEAAIRAIVAEQAAAWDAGDGTRYARHVSPDVSFTNLFGMVMYGAPAFEACS